MNNLNYFISKKKIDKPLKYLITIPCVNRLERNAINVIEKTFEGFENSGLFNSNIQFTIYLFESGSKDTTYLNSIKEKYPNIIIEYSSIPLNGVSNTLKMFFFLTKLPPNTFDFVLWMDDDIYVCKNFIENADRWIKNYANFSIFSSLYVPYESSIIPNQKDVRLSDIRGFYGTCCTVFKPQLAKFVINNWYNPHFERFNYNPDTRFRDSVIGKFPMAKKICVSYPSLVDHMNIGSAIKQNKLINKDHKAKLFIGVNNDPKFN
jgi:hypothetical protein